MYRYAERVEKRLYKVCFGRHRLPCSEQLAGVIPLLRWISQFGIFRTKTQDPPILDLLAKQLASDLIKAIDANDLPGAALSSIRLGYWVSRVRFGSKYLEAQLGMKVVAGGRRGALRVHNINSAEIDTRNREIQAFINKRMRADPQLPYKTAMHRAAASFVLSFESIRKISTNPRPRRKREN